MPTVALEEGHISDCIMCLEEIYIYSLLISLTLSCSYAVHSLDVIQMQLIALQYHSTKLLKYWVLESYIIEHE